MMNCRSPQAVRGPRRIAFAPALRGKAPRFRVRSAAFFARRLRRFFQVIFSKGTYNRKWYIVGRGAVLPRAGHLLDPVAPAAASPHPVGAGGLGGPISFSSERNGGKNAAKNQWFLEFRSSDHSHAAKRPTPNRSCPYPRFRFHVPQENAVSYRRGTVYLRVVRRSGSDKRTARDSLYDDVRQFKSRVVRGGGFQRTPAAQEVLKPAVSSSVFGHFWGCGKK